MDNYVNLLGAEEVTRAGQTIGFAADRMQQAATTIEEALRQHSQNFQASVDALLEAKPTPGMRTVSEEDWRAMVAVARFCDSRIGMPERVRDRVLVILAKEPQ